MPNITCSAEDALQDVTALLDVVRTVQETAGDDLREIRETFESLATVESDCSSAKKGGDLGPFTLGQFKESFEKAALKLDVGECCDPVETSSGWHIILRVS